MKREAVIQRARELGASLAGIASAVDLQCSPSHGGRTNLPTECKSVLVMALVHERSQPELDWWDSRSTPGIRQLRQICLQLVEFLARHGITASDVPYQVSSGGVYVKDAAVLAGLGVIGKNNLLITPEFGSLVRLRALAISPELEPNDPVDFKPCDDCDKPCWASCPRNAFHDGKYCKDRCWAQMNQDIEDAVTKKPSTMVKYCRECEFACPVAQPEG